MELGCRTCRQAKRSPDGQCRPQRSAIPGGQKSTERCRRGNPLHQSGQDSLLKLRQVDTTTTFPHAMLIATPHLNRHFPQSTGYLHMNLSTYAYLLLEWRVDLWPELRLNPKSQPWSIFANTRRYPSPRSSIMIVIHTIG